MAEELIIDRNSSKEQKYSELLPQLAALCESEPDMIANMANLCAGIKEAFGHLWVGFYIVKDEQLVLGPFQGPIACTRIGHGKGVCGKAWAESMTVIVEDVNTFPGHIACSSLSQSEIVVPVIRNGRVLAVLDIDSVDLAAFDQTDQKFLEKLVSNETLKIQ